MTSTNIPVRQHFQGLRRTQNTKAEPSIPVPERFRDLDPAMNPITRRPGPGRGRPRKQPAGAAAAAGRGAIPTLSAQVRNSAIPAAIPGMPPISLTHPHMVAGGSPSQQHPGQEDLPDNGSDPIPSADGIDPNTQHNPEMDPIDSRPLNGELAHPDVDQELQEEHDADEDADGDDADGELDQDADGDDEDEHGPSAKRQRLDSVGTGKDSGMDDEAVLALAAHNIAGPGDNYTSEYVPLDPSALEHQLTSHSFSYNEA